MDPWLLWLIAAGALAAGEVVTLGFFLGPVALAALLAALAAVLGVGVEVQFLIFILGSVASLAVFRPIAARHLRSPARLRSGTAALVGASGVVLERVHGEGGRVKIRGEEWTARSYDSDRVYEAGERVEVLQIDGATALVSE
jgi:membrane protein implicated in regulation of membrane protease activity